MKKLIIIMLLAAPSLFAVDFDINGYVFEMPALLKVDDPAGSDYKAINLSRLRLRPTLNLNEDARITAHYEVDFLLSEQLLPGMSMVNKTNRQIISLSDEIASGDKYRVNHFVDMLYYKHLFDDFEFTLGRQVISWGSGRVWQPTDLFNPINPANIFKYERDGVDAFTAKYYLGSFSDIEVVANFRENIEDNNYAIRIRTNTSGYDMSFMSGYFDNRAVLGGDFAGNLYDAGLRGEVLYSFENKEDRVSYVKAVLGIDYQITADLYAMLEYQFNGEGKSDKSKYEYLRLAFGEIQNLSKNYLTQQVSYKLSALWNVSANMLQNLNDGSGYFGGIVAYSWLENINLKLAGMYFYGDDKTEYSNYGTALYGIMEFYF